MKKQVLLGLMMLLAATVASAQELAVGATAPDFKLVNAVDGKEVAFKAGDTNLKVVVFTSNQCPAAQAFEPRIIEIAERFGPKGVAFYAVNPNDDAKFSEETLEKMKARAVEKGYPFPYLKDGAGKTAKAYGARVTPHVYVVDGSGTVIYRGYVDDSAKKDERTTTGLVDALNATMNGREIVNKETRAFGCAIE